MQAINQITAIVHDDVRLAVQSHVDIGIVFLHGAAMMGKYRNATLYQCRTNIILGGQRVGSSSYHLRPGSLQHQRQISGLCLKVHRHNHALASKWLRYGVFLFNGIHNRHKILYPVDFVMAGRCQGNILNLRFHVTFSSQNKQSNY